MSELFSWLPVALIAVILLAVVGLKLLVRARPPGTTLSREERAELAAAPMAPLQKRAWWGFGIGLLTLGVLSTIVSRAGAAEYYDNDDLRLTVVVIFIVGLIAQALVPATLIRIRDGFRLEEIRLDERDRAILARAPIVQSVATLLTLAAWMIYLVESFQPAGAVPLVYLYLIFGSVVLVNMTSQALGVILGYRLGGSLAQG